ncbi:type II toxin-antitoxin system VapC family toxin [Brevundimonas sp.]|uniref:type II toxin-antitoxin system VapC family toxin n=1 Tax=Brevundimonas sp. TaxID=1871086 RepID=UPI00286C4F93|nr:type II toxin-antitoxin system VapC family toxin [Brevundimonas sp.]
MIVIDTSVALKWVLPEPGAELAKDALQLPLIAPDVWRVEAANGIRRAVLEGVGTQAEAREWLSILDDAPVQDVATTSVLRQGLDLAIALGHPVYDCLFLALAIDRDCRLLTSDDKFRRVVVEKSDLASRIVMLPDLFP